MAAFAAFTFDRNAILSVTKQRFLFVIVPDCWSCFYRPLWGPYPLLTGFYRVLPGFTGFSLAHRGEENAERFGSWRAGFPFFFFFSIGFCFRRSLWSDFSTVSCWFSRSGGGRRVHRRLGGDALRGLDSGRTLHQSRRSRSTNHRSASVLLLFFFVSFSAAIRNRQSSDKSFDFITAAAAIARKLRAAPWARSPCLAPIFFCFCFFRSFSFGRFSVAILLLWSVFVAVITATERPSITTKLLKQRALKMRLRPSYRTLRKWGLQCGRRHFDLIGRWNRSWKSSVFSFQTIIRDRRTIPSLFFVHF